jgi:hypothetical protein
VEDLRTTEREILLEGLGAPLQELRHRAGNPTFAVIATGTGLSEGTLGNVFNGRRLITSANVVAIAEYLGGEREEWIRRWSETSARLTAPSGPAYDVPPGDPVASPRRRTALVVGGAITGAAVGGVLALALHTGPDRDSPTTPDVAAANASREPVAGRPVYRQCDTAARSILSEPGRDRGGEPRGMLRPGELFTVTAKTRYWKYGQVVGDPSRTGWVMSVNLCAVPGQIPGS